MTQRSRRQEPTPPSRLFGGFIVLLVVLTIIGLAIASFVAQHHVDEVLVAALVVIAFTFGGYGTDKIFNRFDR